MNQNVIISIVWFHFFLLYACVQSPANNIVFELRNSDFNLRCKYVSKGGEGGRGSPKQLIPGLRQFYKLASVDIRVATFFDVLNDFRGNSEGVGKSSSSRGESCQGLGECFAVGL